MPIDLFNMLTKDMQLDPQVFLNQIVIVTGAGRGIGFHTSRAFALLGAKVVLAELSAEGKTAEEAIRREGGTALFIQTDVSDLDSVTQLLEQTHQAYGAVDILVNNAIFIHQVNVKDMSTEIWDRTMAVNLRGTFLTSRACLPDLLRKNQGLILNMISTDAMPGLSAYIASKQAITGFSQSLALELEGTGVRVIPFGPGMVDTPGIRSVAGGLAPQLGLTESEFLNLSLHADYQGLMPPEHAAAAAVYLATCLAEEFHGQVINGYEVLERVGFLKASDVTLPEMNDREINSNETTRTLVTKLLQILEETEAEFQKLPVFVRPMAKGGFKNKAGRSLADWQRLASSLGSGAASIPANMGELLEKLATYYREAPTETARFTRDEATLKMVTETAQARLAIIQSLVLAIDR
ncbi:MAG: SDR family oxidoreductase [Brevefilum sp.]|nr:SDR family oxidoreductase [Brevefilum sp.]